MEIPLTRGRTAIIDPDDWPLVSRYSWHAKLENGGLWYAATSLRSGGKKLSLKMHDLIMGVRPGEMADHIVASETLDNRRSNLRVCSNAENQQNTGPRGGSSRFKGVSCSARKKKFLIQFRCHGQYHFVGYFADEEAAACAYDAAIAPLTGSISRRLPESYEAGAIHPASSTRPETSPDLASSMIAALTEGVRRCQFPTSSRSVTSPPIPVLQAHCESRPRSRSGCRSAGHLF